MTATLFVYGLVGLWAYAIMQLVICLAIPKTKREYYKDLSKQYGVWL